MKIRKYDLEYQGAAYYDHNTHTWNAIKNVCSHGKVDPDRLEYFSVINHIPASDINTYEKVIKFHDNDKLIIDEETTPVYKGIEKLLVNIPGMRKIIDRDRAAECRTHLTLTENAEKCIALLILSGDYNLNEAIYIVTTACQRCLNSLLYKYSGGRYGYPEFSSVWFSDHTKCAFCRDTIPMMAYRLSKDEDFLVGRIHDVQSVDSTIDGHYGERYYVTSKALNAFSAPCDEIQVFVDGVTGDGSFQKDDFIIFDGNDKFGITNFNGRDNTEGSLITKSWLREYPRAISRPFDVKAFRKEYYSDDGVLHNGFTDLVWCDVGNYVADTDTVSLWDGNKVEHVHYDDLDAIVPVYKD